MKCEFSEFDGRMMERALALAARGRGHVAPNPMVGAVITAPDGRIIGRGIAMLREAGTEGDCGLLADESERLNTAFFTAPT